MTDKEVIESIKRMVGKSYLYSIYRVGLIDDSKFSDWDLVIITDQKRKVVKGKKEANIDIRFLGDRQEFFRIYKFLPYAQFKIIYGENLLADNFKEEEARVNLVKLSSMFFVSFLRNYYNLLYCSKITTKEVLTHLNDFVYCNFYLQEIPEHIKKFIEEIKFLRSSSVNFNSNDLYILIKKAIDCSWDLIKILNDRLKKEFDVKNPNNFFCGKEPTIFVPGSVQACRHLTESSIFFNRKFKLLYLPVGFQYIFSKNDFVSGFVNFNLSYSYKSFWPTIKNLFKKIYCVFKYFEYLLKRNEKILN